MLAILSKRCRGQIGGRFVFSLIFWLQQKWMWFWCWSGLLDSAMIAFILEYNRKKLLIGYWQMDKHYGMYELMYHKIYPFLFSVFFQKKSCTFIHQRGMSSGSTPCYDKTCEDEKSAFSASLF